MRRYPAGCLEATLIAACIVASCEHPSSQTPTRTARTLQNFQDKLTADLTPESATEAFGKPDRVTGSGLVIYIWTLDDGREVWMGFPAPSGVRMQYAKVGSLDGGFTNLRLR